MKIRTLFIDIGKVLVDFNYETALAAIARLNDLSLEEMQTRLKGHADIPRYETGHLTTEEFFQGMSDLLEIDIPLRNFKKIWGSIFVFDGKGSEGLLSPELFRQLKQSHQLIALSNTNEIHFDCLIQAYPLIREFDDYVLSYQVGSLKPAPQIFSAALDKVGRSPSEVLLVDDRIENVQAAEKMGIQGILFVGEKELRSDLENLGVLG
ncbi:HAD family phosphatase [Acidobacteria bacterium AH-259-L09]|nr:HAD family phosphatase [Acidobacteria bacterium AH-259-L09]